MLKFPILYHKGKGGEIRVWSVWSDGDTVFTEYGVENGIMQISSKKVIAKNVGKKSATTVEEQADKEAKSQWEFKKKRKYSESVDAAEEVLQLPMLAKDYTPDKIVFPALMQPKLDGVRCEAFWDGDRIKLISRAGLEWTVPTHIAEQVANVLPKGSQFDGELYVHGKSCQTITSYVKRLQPQTELVEYHIYDMPVVDGDDTLTNEERHAALTNILKGCQETHLILVETREVFNEKEIKDAEAYWVSQGYEGGIVRNKKGIYRFGYRSWDLQKVKTFKDGEFEVVDCNEGVGKMVGCAIFECRNDISEATFDVTCSVPTPEKQEQYRNRAQYIGRFLTVKFFDRTDDGIPRFPVGKMFRADEDLDKSRVKTPVFVPKINIDLILSKATVKPKDKTKKKSLFDTILEED